MRVDEIEHPEWGACVQLSNGTIELLVATEIGPRIVRYGFADGRNELQAFPGGRDDWPVFGGHRLWHAPERSPRTHVPDDDPVEYEVGERSMRLTRPTDPNSHLRREIGIRVAPTGTGVEVTHRIHNESAWPAELAPWALTVFRPGGTAVLPVAQQAPDDSLLPDRSITLWPYADLADDRLGFETDYVTVRQQEDCDGPTKIGTSGRGGWAAYVRDGHAVRKDFEVDPAADYPDDGCTIEAYTSSNVLELETLGPLETVDPDATAEHVETWTLADGIERPADAFGIEPASVGSNE